MFSSFRSSSQRVYEEVTDRGGFEQVSSSGTLNPASPSSITSQLVSPGYKEAPVLGRQDPPSESPECMGAEGGEEWDSGYLQPTPKQDSAQYLSPLSARSSKAGASQSRPLSFTDFGDSLVECDQAEQDFRKLSMELLECSEAFEKISQQPSCEQRVEPSHTPASVNDNTESTQANQKLTKHMDDVSRRLYKVLYGDNVDLMDSDNEDAPMRPKEVIKAETNEEEAKGAAATTVENIESSTKDQRSSSSSEMSHDSSCQPVLALSGEPSAPVEKSFVESLQMKQSEADKMVSGSAKSESQSADSSAMMVRDSIGDLVDGSSSDFASSNLTSVVPDVSLQKILLSQNADIPVVSPPETFDASVEYGFEERTPFASMNEHKAFSPDSPLRNCQSCPELTVVISGNRSSPKSGGSDIEYGGMYGEATNHEDSPSSPPSIASVDGRESALPVAELVDSGIQGNDPMVADRFEPVPTPVSSQIEELDVQTANNCLSSEFPMHPSPITINTNMIESVVPDSNQNFVTTRGAAKSWSSDGAAAEFSHDDGNSKKAQSPTRSSSAEECLIDSQGPSQSSESAAADQEDLDVHPETRPSSPDSISESGPLPPESPVPQFESHLPEFAAWIAREALSSPISDCSEVEYACVSPSQLSDETRAPSPDSVASWDDHSGDALRPEVRRGLNDLGHAGLKSAESSTDQMLTVAESLDDERRAVVIGNMLICQLFDPHYEEQKIISRFRVISGIVLRFTCGTIQAGLGITCVSSGKQVVLAFITINRSSSPEYEGSDVEYAPVMSPIFGFEDRAESCQSGASDSHVRCLSPDSPLPQYAVSAPVVIERQYASPSPELQYSDDDVETDLCMPWLFEDRASSADSAGSNDEMKPLSPDSPSLNLHKYGLSP
ncbi:hypothetical protein D4764_03G0007340 [Takifugu flavidus]|uniref:Uncharacterized protein n=1 Tax=Takifugu flavidus TaxID=433684 RepID=A0A5C6N901_9TELE|nr:hypothetical protein D4764_03G0007340 [Takifugu flavidus]